MLVVDACDEHNPTSLTGGMSKKIIENIKNDIPMTMKDIIRVVIIHSSVRYTTVLIDRETFEEEHLRYKYYSKHYDKNETLNNFKEEDDNYEKSEISKYIGDSYCSKCIYKYEEKYSLHLKDKLINFWTDYVVNRRRIYYRPRSNNSRIWMKIMI